MALHMLFRDNACCKQSAIIQMEIAMRLFGLKLLRCRIHLPFPRDQEPQELFFFSER